MKLLNQVRKSIVQWIAESQSELRSVTSITSKCESEPVYNFTTETHTYCLTEGIVVHNCDTISMLAVMNAWKPSQVTGMVESKDSGLWSDARFVDDNEEGGIDSYLA